VSAAPEILMEGLQVAALRVKLSRIEAWTEARRASPPNITTSYRLGASSTL